LKKGYEVLLLDDPIDEFTFQHLSEYEKKKLMNVAKGEFKFPDDDDSSRKKLKKLKKLYQPLTDWWRKSVDDLLENVAISQRLVDDPCVIVSSEHGQSANMERISKA
jgi:heat shock protein beta